MANHLPSLLSGVIACAALCGSVSVAAPGASIDGERLSAEMHGVGYVETMAQVIARDALQGPEPKFLDKGAVGFDGRWVVPSQRGSFFPHSGHHYATNKRGDTLMGIGFGRVVNVQGTWIAGQAAEGVWAKAVRVIGYREGAEIARTDWYTNIAADPSWFAIELDGVDRIVFEAQPVYRGAAWYGIDDFTYAPVGAPATEPPIVVDFEEGGFDHPLTDSGYAGLFWESGAAPRPRNGDDDGEGVHAPQVPAQLEGVEPVPAPEAAGVILGGLGTAPVLQSDFGGVIRGDATSFSFPPDTCGAAGTTQIVEVVNRNFAVYDKATGAELMNVLLGSFLPGSNGDPRVLFDRAENRWIVLVTDFDTMNFLAVSTTDDAMGSWFKTSFNVSQGADAGCWPDYPTLGMDANYIYTASYMVNCSSMSIFAVEKAPLVAAVPSLGGVFAFRGLPFEGAIQPTATLEDTNYLVSVQSSSQLRVRRIQDVAGTPQLTELGAVSVPTIAAAPNVPALGSTTAINTVDDRLMNAAYRDGEIWTANTVNAGGRAACAWYRIDVGTLSLADSGVVGDPILHYFFPSIDVNSLGDVVMAFSGAHSGQFVGCYFTGRRGADPAGQMGVPIEYKAGLASQNNIDSFGRNRWGDYSLTTVDPVDDVTFWTCQEYGHDVDIWGTWIAQLRFEGIIPLRLELAGSLPLAAGPDETPIVAVHILAGEDTLVAGSVNLRYRSGGAGAFASIPMTDVGGDVYEVALGGFECGDDPEFYFEAAGTETGAVTLPADAPTSVYAFEVGEVVIFAGDDFETDQGWTVSGDATDGHWQRGVPVNNDRGDPPTDADGSGQCYLTDNDPVVANSDVDGGTTTLTSPLLDISAADTVRWQYWLNDIPGGPIGVEDSMTVEVATDPGSTNWQQVRVYTTTAPIWRADSLAVGVDVAATSTLRLRVSVSDLGAGNVVEGGFDAFGIDAFECLAGASCAADITGPAGPGTADGNVDALDVLLMIAQWGTPCTGSCAADITGPVSLVPDGNVDSLDFLLLIGQWGTPANCP